MQGAAHFLEHMLFLGSKAFPGESDLQTFLTRYAGESNAFTETQHTCVHAELSSDGLEGALERFAAAFQAPLLRIGAMHREVCSQWYPAGPQKMDRLLDSTSRIQPSSEKGRT